jgi:hypothetical protein
MNRSQDFKQDQTQNGNVLVLILFILVTFSILFFLLTQRDTITRVPNFQKESISSISAVQYAAGVEQGVKRMLGKKIPVDKIEFFAPIDEHFDEKTQGDNAKYQLFHPDGGRVAYYPVDRDAVEKVTKVVGQNQNGNWHYFMVRIKGVGSDEPELVAMLYRVKKDICKSINKQLLGNENIPVVHAASEKIFRGAYRLDGEGIDGVASQCVKAEDRYLYYRVLAVQ